MLIEILDENLNLKNTIIYAYGSNENGQLGIDYDPLGNNFYKDWTMVDLSKKIKFEFFVEDINVGDDFSIIVINIILHLDFF